MNLATTCLLSAATLAALHLPAAAAPQIETFAGGGPGGDTAQQAELPATSLKLEQIGAMALDTQGNVYVWSQDNFVGRLLRIDGDTGLSRTVFDAEAAGADLMQAGGLAVDATGNVYVALISPAQVVRIDAPTGQLTKFAGTGTPGFGGDGGPALAAQLQGPGRLALDSRGGLLIADRDAHRVRRVDLASGVITTLAGSGKAGFRGDKGPAVKAQLNEPRDVALDAAGNVYIADYGNNRVRRIDAASGVITTVAGNGKRELGADGAAATESPLAPLAVTLDLTGALVIADGLGNRVRQVEPSSGRLATIAGRASLVGFSGDGGLATEAQLTLPTQLAYDAKGNLYILDRMNERIRRVVP